MHRSQAERPFPFHPDPEQSSIRVLTINVHKGFGLFRRRFVLHELRDAIRTTGADLVFLQEVLGEHRQFARHHANWPSVPQYEFLADTIWTQFAYGRNAVYPDGDHGNGLLSKYPIASHENIDVSVRNSEPRGFLHCVMVVPDTGVRFHALCVHLGLREAHRTTQAERLVAYIRNAIPPGVPLVVAGDFNDWRLQLDGVLGRIGLREAFIERFWKPARTFPALSPVFRLDRIYVRGATVEAASVLGGRPWARLSDHIPLSAQLTL